MNILPIPPLDGGKVAIEIVERIVGTPAPARARRSASRAVGALLLFSLIGYLMYADIVRLRRASGALAPMTMRGSSVTEPS